jgi:hypothetical protein
MAKGIAKFKLGGEQHSLRVPISLAPAIEDACDRGLMLVCRDLTSMTARTSIAIAVIREAFKANGPELSVDDVYTRLEHEGIAAAYTIALAIVQELLIVPERVKSGKAGAAPASAA